MYSCRSLPTSIPALLSPHTIPSPLSSLPSLPGLTLAVCSFSIHWSFIKPRLAWTSVIPGWIGARYDGGIISIGTSWTFSTLVYVYWNAKKKKLIQHTSLKQGLHPVTLLLSAHLSIILSEFNLKSLCVKLATDRHSRLVCNRSRMASTWSPQIDS